MSENTEQLEAHEIDSLPRLVITSETFFIYPPKGETLTLPFEQIEQVKKLMEYLRARDDWRDS